MLVWNNFDFAGIVPRLRPKHLPKGYATVAHNVDLTHGTLKPFLDTGFVKNSPETSIRLYAWGCDLLTWDSCVSVAEWLPDCPRLFITGNADYPQVATLDNGKLVYRRLGVPPPPSPPVATANSVHNDKSRAVAYIATFVNAFGEESGSSPPSGDVVIEDGQRVELTFRYNPKVEYDVKKIRLYRRETGFNTGLEKEQQLQTHWFFLTELDVQARSFVDTISIVDLGWAFEGVDVREPPTALSNITAIPQTAILAGSVANKLLFSRNLQPHNWELSQEMTLDDNIVRLGAVGNSLYVATDGHPYRVQADVGCDKRECRQVHRYAQAFPIISCHTGSGAITTPFGFVYATTDGVVLLTEGANPQIITSEVLSRDDWHELAPHTARFAYYKGALFVVTEKISFILWLDSTTYADSKNKKMTTISDEPVDMTVTRQGELLFLTENGTIEHWNGGGRWRPYRWLSADIDTGFLFDLTRLRATVLDKNVNVSLISPRTKITRTFPVGDTIIPFGRHGRVKTFNIEVTGIGEVTELAAGVSEVDMGSKE